MEIPEQAGENIECRVVDICGAVIPKSKAKLQENVDIVHRLGRLKDQDKRLRTTIIRFTNRSTRDLLWRRAKNCEFLIKQILRFTEDLTSADKVTREKLRLQLERQGKLHFIGARVIIDGKEMWPNQNI